MICLVFNWWFSEDYLLNICITDRECAKTDNKLTIICNNETEIIQCFGKLFNMMQPEFFFGFNSGDYDIPYLVQSAYINEVQSNNKKIINKPKINDKNIKYGVFKYDINYINNIIKDNEIVSKVDSNYIDDIIKVNKKNNTVVELFNDMNLMNPVSYRESTPDSLLKFNFSKLTIKIEATMNADEWTLQFPGFICMDIRTIFRKLYPKAIKSSLNYYLKENNLELKKDMPYMKLFYIYKISSLRQFMLQIYNVDIKTLNYNQKFNIAKLLHNLSEFSTSDLTKIQVEKINEKIPLVKIYMNYNDYEWDKIRHRDRFYKASCLVNLSEFDNSQMSEFQKIY